MTIIDDLKAIESEAAKGIGGVGDLAELDRIRVAVTGKKGSLTGVLRQMGQLDPAARPRVGKLATEVRARLEASLEERKHELEHAALEARIAADSVDVTLPGRVPNVGSEHLISQIIEEIEQIFCGMGYTVEDGPYIETSYYNFTALNAPLDHPSRSARDTFYVEDNNPGSLEHSEAHANGESDILLRTQTSGVQAHTMENHKPPIYMICPGTVFRPDTPDACHLPQFNQIEGLVVDEGITFGDLKGTLDYFCREMFGKDRAQLRGRRLLRRLWGQGLPLLQGHGLARDSRLRHGRPQRARQLRRGPREVHGLCLWHRRRARRCPALRPARPAHAHDR